MVRYQRRILGLRQKKRRLGIASLIFKMATTIKIDDEVWKNLNQLKRRGESHNDVLRRILKLKKREKNDKM